MSRTSRAFFRSPGPGTEITPAGEPPPPKKPVGVLVDLPRQVVGGALVGQHVDAVDRARQHQPGDVHDLVRAELLTADPEELAPLLVAAHLHRVRVQHGQLVGQPVLVALTT
jgi:hypothetical protein